MKRPSFLNKHRTKNNNGVLSSISVLCNESKSHTKKNTNRSSSNNSSSSPHADGGIVSQSNVGNCGLVLPTHADFTDTNAVDELVLNSTTILNNISLEDSYSTSEEAKEVLPSSVAVFGFDDLILCGSTSCNKQSTKKSASVQQLTVNLNCCILNNISLEDSYSTSEEGGKVLPSSVAVFVNDDLIAKEVEVEGGEVSPTGVTEFNVSFGSADFDYFVGNRFSTDDDDLSANDDEQEKKKGEYSDEKKEKKTGEFNSMNNEKTDNVRYTMVEDNKTSKGGKMMKKARKKEGINNKSSLAEFSNTYNDDTFSISLASTNDTSSYNQHDSLPRASIESSAASQQYINEHIQILLDTILLPADVLLQTSVKKEVSHTILPAFKSIANDVTDNIELILTLPADYIANASAKGNVSSSLLNESNISNETIKTSNLLYCGSGSSCIERDFLYSICVD